MFKNKPRKSRSVAPRSSRLRLENLEERQLLTAVGGLDVPYGPDPAPVLCTAEPEIDNSPTVDLTNLAANSESELVLATTGTTWTVTTNANSGDGSLRAAISAAVAGDTITFNLPVGKRVIVLSSSLTINKSLTINASNLYENGTPGITINGNKTCSVIKVDGNATVVINGLTITEGVGSGGYGGGIYVSSNCHLKTINTTISGNTAVYDGGGVCVKGNAEYVSINTIISENTVKAYGGGVYVDSSAVYTSTNTTISGNTAGYGGGVYVHGTYTTQNSIIVGNSAKNDGDEIYGTSSAYASLTSGDKYAIFTDYDKGDYSLKAGSPAIDTGNNDYVPDGVTTDITGLPRIKFGTVDMGAYEYHYRLTSVSISGTVKVGETLTTSVVAESANPTATYQWYREGEAIEGANDAEYKVVADDEDCWLTVEVCGTGDFTGVVSKSVGVVTSLENDAQKSNRSRKAAYQRYADSLNCQKDVVNSEKLIL